MSPRPADPTIRNALIDTAARLLTEQGPQALTTRKLAAEVGTSTMAVYTHFQGMEQLREEVAREGFARLASFLDAIELTDDTVTDVAAMGGAYFLNALSNPYLYRVMFIERPAGDQDVGRETFDRLIAACGRAVEAGRFADADPERLATQLWATSHGIVTLHLAGCLTLEEAIQCFTDMGTNLFVAFGDDRARAERSIEQTRTRFSLTPA